MNKKEIRIDLVPEDLVYNIFIEFALKSAFQRYFKNYRIWIGYTYPNLFVGIMVCHKDLQKVLFFQIKEGFNTEDYLFVKSQYEKGTKTRYYITLIPQ